MAEQGWGQVVLFGSGETSRAGGRIFEAATHGLVPPLRAAVLETPAGFEPNSALVAGRVADFLRQRLQHLSPEVAVVPARQRHTAFSPDDPDLTQPLLSANLVFLGPGSPTYTVRQLTDSLAWYRLLARHRLGAQLVLASAAVLAFGALTLPVYEIYKVGADLHWAKGLDFFGPYGLSLVFIPHWNNAEGGSFLDTSRCFMGRERFARLLDLLPEAVTVVGIDEHTALLVDPHRGQCQALGAGSVTLLQSGKERRLPSGQTFALAELGPLVRPEPPAGIPPAIWAEALGAAGRNADEPAVIPDEVLRLVESRQAARDRQDWQTADALRREIAGLDWLVIDTPEGPHLKPLSSTGQTYGIV